MATNYAIIPGEEIQRMNELTPGAFRLLMFLRYCRNTSTGKCCPSVNVCASGIDVHPKNIFKLRKELSEKKFIEFQGDNAIFLISAKSSKNATADVDPKEDAGEVAKTLPKSSENTTTVAKTLPESQKRYSEVAKTLPNGSENATAYKEEQKKEQKKEQYLSPADAGSEVLEAEILDEVFADPAAEPAPVISISNGRARCREFDQFAARYREAIGAPYQSKRADFIRLAALQKNCDSNNWPLTDDRFARALENYFASELGTRTFADFCTRFSDFYRSPLDRFGKPVQSSGGGIRPVLNGKPMLIDPNQLSQKTRGNAYALQEFIEGGSND